MALQIEDGFFDTLRVVSDVHQHRIARCDMASNDTWVGDYDVSNNVT